MYSQLNGNYKKRHFYNFEDEPPEKKLISDGDILIKQLAQKQRNTKINLDEQLATKSHFYKATEVVSITSFTSGSASLNEFNSVLQHLTNVEKLKSYGLSNKEIELLCDYKKGTEIMRHKHKNINESVLITRLKEILNKIKEAEKYENNHQTNVKCDRLKTETTLATKPTSIETKLLKFALENEKKNDERKIPNPMDEIKDVEQQLVHNLSSVNMKKIRKKARSLMKQINALDSKLLKEPAIKKSTDNILSNASKWDLKESPTENKPQETKVFSCKPQNLYTIRNGEIVKMELPAEASKRTENEKMKLSVEEIKKLPKFENYEKGTPSKVLYLKNLASGIQREDLKKILEDFAQNLVSVNVLRGRMHGQAFIEFKSEEIAEKVLHLYNGIFLKNKPIVIQFGKRKCS